MSGLPAERIKFGFLKDYAIRGKNIMLSSTIPHKRMYIFGTTWLLGLRLKSLGGGIIACTNVVIEEKNPCVYI